MKQKKITIKHDNNEVLVSGTKEEIDRLLKWIKEHKRGKFTSKTIICDLSNDFVVCRQKAKFLKLDVLDPNSNLDS